MAIPIHLQQFKAAGIYRVVFDKSTIVNYDTELLRLVVGYSEQGPFNIPVYVKDPQTFTALFGGINKKLERRGIYFHRLALQMVSVSPILVLNLKKFSDETVGAISVNTDFNPSSEPIDEVKLRVEDIYDTTRFWELNAEKLNNLTATDGSIMDQYINIATTNTKKTSSTIFIRKASGNKVSGYNITVNDWYSDNPNLMPEFLEHRKNNLISDFFAEVYVFNGQFTAKQVLASDTLKNYFIVEDTGETDEQDNQIFDIKLRDKVYNAFGDPVDTLDTLYADPTSNALGHYIGCLIPEFKNKNNAYMALDILFNTDQEIHNCMMSFNTDLLYEYETGNIDISGRLRIPTIEAISTRKVSVWGNTDEKLTLDNLFNGSARTTVMNNTSAPVITDTIVLSTNATRHESDGTIVPVIPFRASKKSISGSLYVIDVQNDYIELQQVAEKIDGEYITVKVNIDPDELINKKDNSPISMREFAQTKFGVVFKYTDEQVLENDSNLLGAKKEGDVKEEAHDAIEAKNAVYSFESYNNAQKEQHYGTGKVEVLEINKGVATVKVTENSVEGFVGNEYKVRISTATSGIAQLYNTNGDAVDIWVTVTKISDAVEAKPATPETYYTAKEAAVYNSQLPGSISLELNDDVETQGKGTAWPAAKAGEGIEGGPAYDFDSWGTELAGPERLITNIRLIEPTEDDDQYTDADKNMKVSFFDVQIETNAEYNKPANNKDKIDPVYGTSVSFIDHVEDNWQWDTNFELIDGIHQPALVSKTYYDKSLTYLLQVGDCLLAEDNIVDYDENGEHDDADNYYDCVYVNETGTKYDDEGNFVAHYVLLSGKPMTYPYDEPGSTIADKLNQYLVRIDAPLNQEVGTMKPIYLEGYTYLNARPTGSGMYAKLEWQKTILSALNTYKGLRTGLLNKSEIDYRYVIDTFESFPDASIKKELSYLCKQKQSAFCIANFPSVQTFTKCPYASFTDAKKVFNVEYIVKGCNKKKAATVSFSLPDDTEGGSFIAFYSPLKFSDGYLDTIVPSAGLVSNLFIEKYMTRQPYYIVAGPNYGRIAASGLVGPDYKYSMDELQIIEPFGVNCMVYRPNFGTFINANQTAKQAPLSALSKVHVRELVIYLQDEIEKVLQAYQWEFNNARTREAILTRANDICARVMSNGGLQAYLNIMDESNNTPEIIDNEMAVLSTHIEPGMGCGKMVHELTLYRTGRMMATINEGI